MKKTIFIIVVLAILFVLWQLSMSKKELVNSATGEFKSQILTIDDDHQDVLLTIDNPPGDTAISFAVIEQGNKNVFGNIIESDLKSGDHKIIDTFGTSPFRFEDTVSFISDYEIKFTETAVFGGGDSFSTEKIIDLKNADKNIKLPALEDDSEAYFLRHGITDATSVNEFGTVYKWVDNNTVEFERSFSDSIGNQYLLETWQYNIETMQYARISE